MIIQSIGALRPGCGVRKRSLWWLQQWSAYQQLMEDRIPGDERTLRSIPTNNYAATLFDDGPSPQVFVRVLRHAVHLGLDSLHAYLLSHLAHRVNQCEPSKLPHLLGFSVSQWVDVQAAFDRKARREIEKDDGRAARVRLQIPAPVATVPRALVPVRQRSAPFLIHDHIFLCLCSKHNIQSLFRKKKTIHQRLCNQSVGKKVSFIAMLTDPNTFADSRTVCWS